MDKENNKKPKDAAEWHSEANKILIRIKKNYLLFSGQQQPLKTFDEGLDKIVNDLKILMLKKQRDYGYRNITDFGHIGLIMKMNDKLARLKNLYGITDGSYQKKPVANESLEDSFRDLANYAIIALMLKEDVFKLPLREQEKI